MPGPRDPSLTPYVIDFTRAFDIGAQIEKYGRAYRYVAFACGSQMGKTDSVLDIIGETLDQRPAPLLYVGPTENFIAREIEPRLREMIMDSAVLRQRVAGARSGTRYRKVVGGVPVALAWAGSAAQVAGMAAKKSLVDELDRIEENSTGEGDIFGLLEARGFSYADSQVGAISTPLIGVVDTEKCDESGLDFWAMMDPDDVQSPIWRLFQAGTRHHWAWPCPHCGEYFIPRLSLLQIRDDATTMQAEREAHLLCPRCEGVIEERQKKKMNQHGVYVAPGELVDSDGVVTGEPSDVSTLSFWVSGLCSPFVSFGRRASSLQAARNTQRDERIQAVVNTGFGECYAPGAGDVPKWFEVSALKRETPGGIVPDWAKKLTLAADIQRTRIIYTIRAWGAWGTSRTIEAAELHGFTTQQNVWQLLARVLTTPRDGMVIDRALIDSGFRPGKPENVPVNMVYAFCRQFKNRAFASKGRDTADKPVFIKKADINARGDIAKYGLDLVWLDTDHCKRTVHEKIKWAEDAPGNWTLHADITDDYCKQIVAEARTRNANSGKPVWTALSRENHFLDCEAMQEGLGHWLNMHLLRDADAATRDEPTAKTDKQALMDRLKNAARRRYQGGSYGVR